MNTIPKGQEPKRARGHERVAAIMQAGVALFAEKGYDATTMTEIAARSETAIASLYRFFPTKESLAEALLRRYAEHMRDALAELAGRAASMSPDQLAEAFVAFAVALGAERRFATGLAEGGGANATQRSAFRRMMRDGLAGVLRSAMPELAAARAGEMAMAVLGVLKGLYALAGETPAVRRALQRDMREMLAGYFASALAAPHGR
jgi:AcrR family transcriptional regulator